MYLPSDTKMTVMSLPLFWVPTSTALEMIAANLLLDDELKKTSIPATFRSYFKWFLKEFMSDLKICNNVSAH